MAWTALDFGFRGATVGLVLMILGLLLCDRPFRTLTTLRIALGAGAAAYAISTAPFFPLGSFGWNAPRARQAGCRTRRVGSRSIELTIRPGDFKIRQASTQSIRQTFPVARP
jgi:hypothetical protein